MAKIERVDFDTDELYFVKRKTCPLDNKKCDYDTIKEDQDPMDPMRGCRHNTYFNSNIQSPPCGRDMFRKRKSSKSKSKRKICKCKK